MPPMSTVRTFIRALQTRRTQVTTVLDDLMANGPAGGQHPGMGYLNNLQGANFSGALPSWAKNVLIGRGLDPIALAHLDNWPGKEAVREEMVKAIGENRSIQFFWELHDGNDEENAIAAGAVTTITFRSPKWKVRSVGPDNIVVDV